MAGPVHPAELRISTSRMGRILQYEPRDLTISVEAGMPFARLNAELAKNGQMIPLDGPWVDSFAGDGGEGATVGGMIAANISGSRRRLYGTARDNVIGMRFATLDGKLVDSGGMVVKNVAGLDMAKLMIGSFGTLAAIASVNFKLTPRPKASCTLLFSFEELQPAITARDRLLKGVLAPVAVDILNPILSAQFNAAFGTRGFTLATQFSGNDAVIRRSSTEAAPLGPHHALTAEEEQRFWTAIAAITPRFLEKFTDGAVVRVSTTLKDCATALASLDAPGHAHAANGIVRAWFSRPESASRWTRLVSEKGWKSVVEFSGGSAKHSLDLWPQPGGDIEIMHGLKKIFDPAGLLNPGRLYGRI